MDDDELIHPDHPLRAAARGLHGVTEEILRTLDAVMGGDTSVGLFTGTRCIGVRDDGSWSDPVTLEALIRVRRPQMVVMARPGEDEVWTRTVFHITAQRILALRCELVFDEERDRIWRWEPIAPTDEAERVREQLGVAGASGRSRARELSEGPYVDLRTPSMIEQQTHSEIRRLVEAAHENPAPSARVIHGRWVAETTDFPSGALPGLEDFIATHEVRRVFALEQPASDVVDAFGITSDLILGWRFALVRDAWYPTIRQLNTAEPSARARRIRQLIVETRPVR